MTDASLPKRCALVTGSLGGLGLAIAEALARAGCDIVLSDIDISDKGADCCAAIGAQHSVVARYVAADLSSHAGAAGLVDSLRQRGRLPDILVNNAVVATLRRSNVSRRIVGSRTGRERVRCVRPRSTALPEMRTRGWDASST